MANFYQSFQTSDSFPGNSSLSWSPFGPSPATPNNWAGGGTGAFARLFPAPEATPENPSVLFWIGLNGGGFALNFGDGQGWSILSDGDRVYQTLTNTQKANIKLTFSALENTRRFPGSLYSVLVQGW